MNGPAFSQCSNDTWNLYQANGFFCCETDQIGFTSTETATDGFYGCAEDSTFDNTIMRSLSIIKMATESTSTSASSYSSTTAPSVTTTPSTTNTSSTTPISAAKQSTPDAKGIAGGVVGGVCAFALIAGIIWLIIRRRRSQASAKGEKSHLEPDDPSNHSDSPLTGASSSYYEAHALSELPSDSQPGIPSEALGENKPRFEMPVDNRARSELPATRQPPSELP
ncbi:hypothetical protein N7537_010654 [Penicillium hordei]|uniref:Uncharacterized protein n=1 Tax=Penicillium hordei TaxID=40994 RepID=A0AAD6DV19_9EURO|nr:uncharacterized protein N7537_010654 [Penicillium hordei]KAJ5593750.1 hypothetical protein N7537_010654 [Penicillium hordei]